MKRSTPESGVLKACMDLLAVHRIWHMRMNTGAMKDGKRFIRFSRPGTADILATPKCCWSPSGEIQQCPWKHEELKMLWLECKSPVGEQSAAQKAFQLEVEAAGHLYLLIRSPEDLLTWLRAHSVIP